MLGIIDRTHKVFGIFNRLPIVTACRIPYPNRLPGGIKPFVAIELGPQIVIDLGRAGKLFDIVNKDVPKHAVRQGFVLELGRENGLQHELDGVPRKIICVFAASGLKQKFRVGQFVFGQINKLSFADFGHLYTATAALICGCGS
jgi:hypothetical protein